MSLIQLLLSVTHAPDEPDELTPPPDLAGKYATVIGDSVVAGSSASIPANRWGNLLAVALNGLEQNEGQGGHGVYNYDLTAISPADSNHEWVWINLVINSVYSSPETETDPPSLGSLWWQYSDGLQALIDDLVSKGYSQSKIVVDTCYYIAMYATNNAPWRQTQYSREIKRVCQENGLIYADLFTYMNSFADKADCLADNLHQNDLGMSRVAEFHLEHLDYTPQGPVNPLLRTKSYYTTAASNIDFEDVGVDADNIEIIFHADDPALCYVPGKTGNTITGMVNGDSYLVVPKLHEILDLGAVGLPHPISYPTSGAAEAAAFVAATGRSSQATAIETLISGLKNNGLWWKVYGAWMLDTSFNVAKYNMRDATATLTEAGGAGTWASDGWTGGLTKALLSGITLDDYDKTCAMLVSIVSDAHEIGTDFGTSGGTATSSLTTRTDYVDPPVASFASANWNNGGSWPLNTTDAIGRWIMVGGKDYGQGYRDGVPFNNYYAVPSVAGVTVGQFTIGNFGGLTGGSTKKMRFAIVTHCLDEQETNILDTLVAAFEVDAY